MLGQELILNLWSTTHLCSSSTFLRIWFSDLATKQERASVSLLRFSLTCFSLVVSYKQLQSFLFLSFSDRPCPPGVDQPHLSESNPTNFAELVLANAVKMKCRRFVRAKDIIKGNAKLNLAFVCNPFNNVPAQERNRKYQTLKRRARRKHSETGWTGWVSRRLHKICFYIWMMDASFFSFFFW